MNKITNKIIKTTDHGTTQENGIQYVSDKAMQLLMKYDSMEESLKKVEKQVEALKKSIYQNMEQNGVKSFEVGDYKFTYVAPTDTMVINTQKLKDEGMYEYFKDKPQHRSGYVKYTRKKAEATA